MKKVPLHPVLIIHKICNHVVGENHTLFHRIIMGAIIIAIGHGVSSIEYLHYIAEGIGEVFRGIGAIPVVELAGEVGKKFSNK